MDASVEATAVIHDQARLAAIVASADDAIISKSLDGTIESWNPAAERMFSYKAEEIIGKNIRLLIPPDRQDEESMIVARLIQGETIRHYESKRSRKDGTLIDVSLTVSPIKDSTGKIIGASKILRDISLQKFAEARIQSLLRTASVLSNINSLIVRVQDQTTLFQQACKVSVEIGKFRVAWIGILSWGDEELKVVAAEGNIEGALDTVPLSVVEKNYQHSGLVELAIAGQVPVVSNNVLEDVRIEQKEECRRRGVGAIAIFPLLDGARVVGILGLQAAESNFFDDAEMKLLCELAGDITFAIGYLERLRQLDKLAYYDIVTALPNRTLFSKRLMKRIAMATQADDTFPILIIDIERFKTLNDTFGRNEGDRLLREIATRCKSILGPRVLARLGSDQFAVIMPGGTDPDSAERMIENRVKLVFDPLFTIQGIECSVSARYGVALFPEDGTDAETLLRNAESALNKAKVFGERCVFYTKEISARVAENLTLENSLRRAIERNEFVLYYQPKVDTGSRVTACVEALIRWQSPERGLVAPDVFIPLLERTGLILEVGAWVLRRAVADWHTMTAMGLAAPRIAVNVSAIQLRRPDFVDTFRRILLQGEDCAAIDIEITESLVMENVQANIVKLAEIHAMGVEIAIDDFGTGYSSLAYLAKLPVQILKIDRAFINSLTNDSDAMTLVSTMINLAHSLNMRVVAEGVETEEQAKFLKLLRCEQMQGYLFGKPMPLDELITLICNQERYVGWHRDSI